MPTRKRPRVVAPVGAVLDVFRWEIRSYERALVEKAPTKDSRHLLRVATGLKIRDLSVEVWRYARTHQLSDDDDDDDVSTSDEEDEEDDRERARKVATPRKHSVDDDDKQIEQDAGDGVAAALARLSIARAPVYAVTALCGLLAGVGIGRARQETHRGAQQKKDDEQ